MKFYQCSLILILSLLTFLVNASNLQDSLHPEQSKTWAAAEISFRKCIEKNDASASTYYNLGTRLATQQKFSEAMWALEKSLKLDPNSKKTEHNLQFCYKRMNFPNSWEPALPYLKDKAYRFGIANWTNIASVMAFISATLIFLMFIIKKSTLRKITLIFAIFSTLFLIFSLSIALISNHYRFSQTHAIIIEDQNSVFMTVNGNKRIDFVLKAGMRYRIGTKSEDRMSLETYDNNVIWVDSKSVRTF